jgi:predicted phosphodiesterase
MAAAQKTPADMLVDAEAIIRKRNSEIADLRRTRDRLQKEADTAEEIRRVIYEIKECDPEPPAWISKLTGPNGKRGGPVTIWSDWHWGETVSKAEVGGVNEFNAGIARKRAKALVERTIDLSFNHMGRAKTEYPGLVLCLGGDMISGDIHEELMVTNDRTPLQAVNDLTDCLAGGIDALATKFGKVFIPCVAGNHGRNTHKIRAKGHLYTNYDWNIYCNLARYYRGNKHVQFLIPPENDAFFNVYGHRFLLTHGHTLGVKGGDGIIGAIGPIMRGRIKVGRSETQVGRDFDTLLMGHWHQMLWLPGCIVNGALKGYDEYARLFLRAPYAQPSQALFFVHPEHGLTAKWEVFLDKQRRTTDNKDWVTFQAA